MERDFPADKTETTCASSGEGSPKRAKEGSLGRDFPQSQGVWGATSPKRREFGARLWEFGARLSRKGGRLGRDFPKRRTGKGVWGATFKGTFFHQISLVMSMLRSHSEGYAGGVWSATFQPHCIDVQPLAKLLTALSFLHPFIPRTNPRFQPHPLKVRPPAGVVAGRCSFVALACRGLQSSRLRRE